MARHRKLGYVYVLHFDSHLHHAGHYIGATFNLLPRLKRHAHGYAARLTTVLREEGIGWQVGAVYITAALNTYEAEREAKGRHRAACLCDICGGIARLRDATRIEPTLLRIPLTSQELAEMPCHPPKEGSRNG